MLWDNIV